MATYDLHRSELNSLLASDHIDPSVRKAIIDYLEDDGLLHSRHSTVSVQGGTNPSHGTQVLIVDTPNATVNTSADPNLKAIVDISGGELKVTGGDNVIVATGPHVNLIDLSGASGNVVVDAEGSQSHHGGNLFGDGGNYSTMWGGHGDDSWFGGRDGDRGRHDGGRDNGDHGWSDGRDGGRGNDGGWCAGGNFDTIGGSRHDGWSGGGGPAWGDRGHYTTLPGGYGDDRGHHDRRDGGRGDDDHGRGHQDMHGGHGGHHEMDGGGTTTIVAGTGNETMIGGNGNYLFEVGPHGGNDDIVGGKGNNTVEFDHRADDVKMTTQHGVTTVTFSDTHETVKLTGIQNIVFTDHK
jgi:hypothetical protein